MKKILLVEDNESIVKGLKYLLQKNYVFDSVLNYEDALTKINNNYDLVILDISLPDGNGLDLAKLIKTPILFLSANDLEENIVRGLELGEDYLLKPFRNQELLMRIEKILKRNESSKLIFKDYVLDNEKMKLFKGSEEFFITPLEFKIISLFFNNIGKVVTRDKIFYMISVDKFIEDNTLTVYVKRIRNKFGLDDIKTVKGIGYILDEN